MTLGTLLDLMDDDQRVEIIITEPDGRTGYPWINRAREYKHVNFMEDVVITHIAASDDRIIIEAKEN